MSAFDSVWKEALDVYFEPFMAFSFAKAHREIDWARGSEMLDKELEQVTPESEQGRRVVDKLVKVWRTDGKDEWVLVHVEVQSQQERAFAERMFVYNYRLFDRYNRKVASFAILGDDRPGWRPDRFAYELWGTRVGIEFATAKLLDYAGDESALESHANPFAVVVLAHLKTLELSHDDDARRVSEVRLVKGLYERGFSAEQIRQLYRLIEGMMDLPKPLAILAWKEIREFAKEKSMPFITGAEIVVREEALAEGRAEGLAKGREEGREEGLLAGIRVALEIKFAAQGLTLMPEIQRIQDVRLLRKVLEAVGQAETPEAVRQVWSET
jgi:hypothetical protein